MKVGSYAYLIDHY